MPIRILAIAACFTFVGFVSAGAEDKTAIEEAAKVLMRPVCADQAARAKIVAKMIEQGGEYERDTAKWDMDSTCEQIDLPTKPVHDTADLSDDASHKDWIYDARWSPDGKLIATAGRDGTVRLWDVATGKMVRKIDVTKLPSRIKSDNPGHVRAGRFLGDGRSLVVAADTHPVRIFDVASGEPIAEVPYAPRDPKEEIAPAIAATASGLVILGGYASDLIVYDVNAKAERYRVPGSPNNYPVFAVSDAGGFLATTTPAAERSVLVQLRKLETGEVVWQTEAQGDISSYAMAFSRNGKQLAAAVHGLAYVYATSDKRLTNKVMIYPTFGSFDVAFTADGQKLIAGQRHAQLWDIATGRRVLHYGPFSDLCHAIDVSPDGKYLATGHMGSDGRIWEIDTGTFFRRLGKNVYPPG